MWIGYFIKKQNKTKMDRGMFSFVFPLVVHLFLFTVLLKVEEMLPNAFCGLAVF